MKIIAPTEVKSTTENDSTTRQIKNNVSSLAHAKKNRSKLTALHCGTAVIFGAPRNPQHFSNCLRPDIELTIRCQNVFLTLDAMNTSSKPLAYGYPDEAVALWGDPACTGARLKLRSGFFPVLVYLKLCVGVSRNRSGAVGSAVQGPYRT